MTKTNLKVLGGGREMIPKFRAWLPRQKEMVDVREMTFVEGKVRCVYYKTGTEDHDDGSSSDILSSACYEGVTFNLMQYTGVKDCNGKEIYEGDVVEITYDKRVWDAIPAYCGSRKAKYDYLIDSLEDFFYTRKRGYIADSEFKVLGNIYENPELKKEEK